MPAGECATRVTCCGIFPCLTAAAGSYAAKQHAAQGSYQPGPKLARSCREKFLLWGLGPERGHHRHLVYDKLYRQGILDVYRR